MSLMLAYIALQNGLHGNVSDPCHGDSQPRWAECKGVWAGSRWGRKEMARRRRESSLQLPKRRGPTYNHTVEATMYPVWLRKAWAGQQPTVLPS